MDQSETVKWKADICISGVVQGVGFRPFVARLARERGVTGSVRNAGGQVLIEAFGSESDLRQFVLCIRDHPPGASNIAHMEQQIMPVSLPQSHAPKNFAIEESREDSGAVNPSPDIALCDDCLRELFTPGDPRFENPLISCAHCGPRFSILRRTPYDRETTTMGRFAMCALCAAQYGDSADRRFHAQTVCCNHCGPELRWQDRASGAKTGAKALDEAINAILCYHVIAAKGIGGFHLACNARSGAAVAETARPERPRGQTVCGYVSDT